MPIPEQCVQPSTINHHHQWWWVTYVQKIRLPERVSRANKVNRHLCAIILKNSKPASKHPSNTKQELKQLTMKPTKKRQQMNLGNKLRQTHYYSFYEFFEMSFWNRPSFIPGCDRNDLNRICQKHNHTTYSIDPSKWMKFIEAGWNRALWNRSNVSHFLLWFWLCSQLLCTQKKIGSIFYILLYLARFGFAVRGSKK